MKILILHWSTFENLDLSYQHGWVKAFKNSSEFTCEFTNVKFLKPYHVNNFLRKAKQCDFVVVLHSVFSNARQLSVFYQILLRLNGKPVVFFVGNEYKHMEDKISFCRTLNCKLFVTQSLDPSIIQMYQQKLGCKVVGIPSGGLDEELFFPGPPREKRKIDIGFRAFDEPFYFGHQERRQFMEASKVASSNFNFSTDFSMDIEERYSGVSWGDFLRNCKSTIGSSSGFDYFDLNDNLRKEVNKYCSYRNLVTFEEVERDIFSKIQKKAKMRLISGRIIEAAGTKTTLILLEDEYSGYLQPNKHYIPVKKDFSNIETAFKKLSDDSFCNEITNNAYEVVVTHLTFKSHLKKFKRELQAL